MMGCLWSLFCGNSGVDPDGPQKSGTNCPSFAVNHPPKFKGQKYIKSVMGVILDSVEIKIARLS